MKKGLFALYHFYDDSGALHITEEGYGDIQDLADIVIAKHFYLNSEIEQQDLKSIGILKVLEMLQKGDFDPSRSSLKNYCYSGMRNEMKNYLYRNERMFPVDDEILATNVDSVTSASISDDSDTVFNIRLSEIKPFLGRNPNELQAVVNSLVSLGFSVEGGYKDTGYIADEGRVSIIQCQVIWMHLERCQL